MLWPFKQTTNNFRFLSKIDQWCSDLKNTVGSILIFKNAILRSNFVERSRELIDHAFDNTLYNNFDFKQNENNLYKI